MNYLAHIYLSGDDTELTIGNFIADFVKGGKEVEQYSKRIQQGIVLHREIDEFTDRHDIVGRSKQLLRQKYRHYAAVIVDIFYDHYLATNWLRYSDEPLHVFVKRFYQMITDHKHLLPDNVNKMLPYMISKNWLVNYANFYGINQVMYGMSTRTQHDSKMEESIEDLKKNYKLFEKDFFEFFPILQIHCKKVVKLLLPKLSDSFKR